jgi:G3E family GTPase
MKKIPVTVLTGVLGSGKTTLLNRMAETRSATFGSGR